MAASKNKNKTSDTTAKTKAQDLLKTYGNVISKAEVKAFQEAGFKPSRASAFAQNRPEVTINQPAKTFIKEFAATANQNTADTAKSPAADLSVGSNLSGGYSADEMLTFLEQEASREQTLARIDKNTRITLGTLDADARKEAARLAADAQIRSTGISADATRYVSDREKEAILQRAEIESKGRLDLQAIINAGMKSVAEVEGLTARDVATIGGEYGVKQEQTRQSGQVRIANIARNAGILQGLVGAFNF